MARRHRQVPDSVLDRRTLVARLLRTLDHPTLGLILRAVIEAGVTASRATIARDIAWVREEWRSERLKSIDAHVDTQLARVAQVEQEAWRAIALGFRSATRVERNYERVVAEDAAAAPDVAERVRMTSEKQIVLPARPNTGAMEVVLRCIAERDRILGVNGSAIGAGNEASPPGQVFAFTLQIGGDLHATLNNNPETMRALTGGNGRPVVVVDSRGRKHKPEELTADAGSDNQPA